MPRTASKRSSRRASLRKYSWKKSRTISIEPLSVFPCDLFYLCAGAELSSSIHCRRLPSIFDWLMACRGMPRGIAMQCHRLALPPIVIHRRPLRSIADRCHRVPSSAIDCRPLPQHWRSSLRYFRPLPLLAVGERHHWMAEGTESPDRLYKALTGYAKPQKNYTKT